MSMKIPYILVKEKSFLLEKGKKTFDIIRLLKIGLITGKRENI